MDKAAVSRLKARLSEYLAKVKAGEEVVVTERGRPVARLIPVEAGEESGEQGRLLALERAGEIRLGSGKIGGDFWEMFRLEDAEGSVRSAVSEERAEGW